MLSDYANELARELRSHVRDQVGIGPDMDQLVRLWGARDPGALRPAIDELAGCGFIRINTKLGSPHAKIGSEYAVRDVAAVAVTEALQVYLDTIPA